MLEMESIDFFNQSAVILEDDYSRFNGWKDKLMVEICKPYRLDYVKLSDYDIMIPYCSRSDNGVDKSVYVNQLYMRIIGRENSIVIDGKMNEGYFSLIAAYFNATVIGFETDTENIDAIQRSLFINNLNNRVKIFRNGLSHTYFNITNNNAIIQMIPFDSILPLMEEMFGPKFKVQFMKINKDNFGNKFLMGARDLFIRHEIKQVMMESVIDFDCKWLEFKKLMNLIGFGCSVYTDNGIEVIYDESEKSWNNFLNKVKNGNVDMVMYNL